MCGERICLYNYKLLYLVIIIQINSVNKFDDKIEYNTK